MQSAIQKEVFIEDSADVMGSHPSTVAHHIKIASKLAPKAKRILRGAKKPVSSAILKKKSRLPPEQQAEASSMLGSGKIKVMER